MLRRAIVVLLPFVFLSASLAQTGLPDHCADQQPLPFAAIAVTHPVDHSCGVEGKATSPDKSKAQNTAKNNFCASGTPETITPQSLVELQTSNPFPSGYNKEPTSRADLQAAGEGKLVRMKAYLVEAHHADLGGGESVNCNGAKEEDNDIHIAFASDSGAKECASVSAEISPHYRPKSWNEIGHYELYSTSTKKYTVNAALASRLTAHPYRVTGQLFFDASHAPCPCGTVCNPIRASVWEIHPVYAIEVCKAGASCDVENDADWIAFDTWWNSLAPAQPARGPHSHSSHEGAPTSSHSTHSSHSGGH